MALELFSEYCDLSEDQKVLSQYSTNSTKVCCMKQMLFMATCFIASIFQVCRKVEIHNHLHAKLPYLELRRSIFVINFVKNLLGLVSTLAVLTKLV